MTEAAKRFNSANLVYLNNRNLDPSLGVFISVDPLVAQTGGRDLSLPAGWECSCGGYGWVPVDSPDGVPLPNAPIVPGAPLQPIPIPRLASFGPMPFPPLLPI